MLLKGGVGRCGAAGLPAGRQAQPRDKTRDAENAHASAPLRRNWSARFSAGAASTCSVLLGMHPTIGRTSMIGREAELLSYAPAIVWKRPSMGGRLAISPSNIYSEVGG
jgi:hypothetical protein